MLSSDASQVVPRGLYMHTIKQWLKLKSWHRVIPRSKKRPEGAEDFLDRIIRLAAARASMASWGQPFEAIASWMLLSKRMNKNRSSSSKGA